MDLLTRHGSGPYVGRQAFDVVDQDVFFGRERERAELKALWAHHTLVIMHGPAGSGKTSLLRAGLGQAAPENADLLPVGTISPRTSFPEAVLPAHNPYTLAVLSSWSPAEARTRLSQFSVTDFIVERALPSVWSGAPPVIVAVIDQLEEIFTGTAETRYRDELFGDLAMAMQAVPQLRVVLSIRNEALGALETYNHRLGIGAHAYVSVEALERDAALEAVTRPMERLGLPFAPGVAEKLIDDLGTAQLPSASTSEATTVETARVEPVQIQVVCSRLYRMLPHHASAISLSLPDVHSYVDRSLAGFCADVVCEVAAEHEKGTAELSYWLARTFITPQGARRAIPERGATAASMPYSLTRALENRHLLTAKWESGVRWYTLANDRLIPVIRQLNQPSSIDNVPDINAASHLQVALNFRADGDLVLAEKHAWHALRSADDEDLRLQADARSLLGNIAFDQDRPDTAEEHYRRAAELSEQLRDHLAVGRLLGAVGRIQAKQGRHLAALEDLHSAVTRMPGDLTMRTELAKALWQVGQMQAAAAIFGTVLTIEPEFAAALAGRGQIRAETGDASSALDDLQTLRRLHPNIGMQPEVRSAYALALARAGRPEIAMEEADAALAEASDNGPIFFRAARVASVSGASARAAALLRRAAEARSPALSADQLDEARRLLTSVGEPDA
jgi:tetratricopeptide (TPR) repeat protein